MAGRGSPVARTSLGRLFLLWLVGVLVLTLLLVSGLVLDHLRRVLEAELDAHGRAIARAMAAAVGEGRIPAELPEAVLGDVRSIEVRNPQGTLLWRFGPPADEAAALAPGTRTLRERVPLGTAADAIREGPLEVVVNLDTARIRRHLAVAAVRMVIGMGLALAAALVVGLAVVAAIVQPLKRLADHAREHGSDRPWPSAREVGGSAEVVELARALSEMGERLAEQRRSLAASERRWRALVESSPTPLLEVDRSLAVVEANPAARALLGGGDPTEALQSRLAGTTADLLRARMGEDLADGDGAAVEARWRLPDGEIAEVELQLRGLEAAPYRRWLVAVHDQTGRVRRLGELWRRTFDAMADGVALLESDGAVRLANRAFVELGPGVAEEATARAGDPLPAQWEFEHAGRVLACSLSRPEGLDHLILVVRDRTEAASAAARLREAETLRAIGTLAGGIAHDFNNLLAGILVNLRLLEHRSGTAEGALQSIRELAEQGSEVVHELLLLARRETTPRRPLDLADLVRQQSEVLRHLLTAETPFRVQVPDHPVAVDGSPVALRRLLLNLVLNSRDAVRATGGGIGISVTPAGEEVVLEVSDEGEGMSDATREHLLEPFWSGGSRGAGLGLAVVDAVVSEHGGRLEVESGPGRGTRVTVRLPRLEGSELEPEETAESELDGVRVLVVEPEAAAAAELVAELVAAGADARHARGLGEARRLTRGWAPQALVVGGGVPPAEIAATRDAFPCPALASGREGEPGAVDPASVAERTARLIGRG